jgi:hypothetical protein
VDREPLLELLDQEQRAQRRTDKARELADAAAHQLARHVSDYTKSPHTPADAGRDTLLNFVSVYDLSWVGYIDAREAWREANRRALDAQGAQGDTERPQTDVEA